MLLDPCPWYIAGPVLGVVIIGRRGVRIHARMGALTDPRVIRDMMLLKEPHVFLIMGSAVAIAAIGVRVLKASRARCIVTGDLVGWSVERPRTRHVTGSILFVLGWTVAGTCPGPVAAMIGEGRLVGVPVVVGLLAGVTLQRMLAARKNVELHMPAPAATGL